MKRIIMMVLRNILFVPWGWFMLNKYVQMWIAIQKARDMHS